MATRKRICIDRKSYKRRGFTRADGTRVGPSVVKASRFCIDDPGTPGRRARGSEKGPFSDEPAWIKRSGDLGGPGFSTRPDADRHALLRASVRRYGYRSTLGKLGAILRNTELHGRTRRTLEGDRMWLVNHFGGPGSFGKKPARKSARNRQLGTGRYEILTAEGPVLRLIDRDEAIAEAMRLRRGDALVFDVRTDRVVWQAARRRSRFAD